MFGKMLSSVTIRLQDFNFKLLIVVVLTIYFLLYIPRDNKGIHVHYG